MIIFSNRITKLIGLLVKGISYIFHFIFPNKRFTIPEHSSAILSSSRTTKIPKILWQTNFTNKVTLPVYINYLVNRLMSLSYEYRYASNEKCLEMIKELGTKKEVDAFLKLKDGAAKADYWRIFALNKVGGVYLDLDGQLVWPLSLTIKDDDEELYVVPRRDKYTNYFIASKVNNQILQDTLNKIISNIENIDNIEEKKKSVYYLTGPSTLIEIIGDKIVNCKKYKYVCAQGSFTNEHFQYIDKKNGKWIHTKKDEILN